MNPVRIAMWSGPRNISTAMMRAWENRRDCDVWDEPLYGYYLHKTGLAHPGAAEVIAAQGTDWKAIVNQCSLGSAEAATNILFQKHMTLHLLPEISRDWLSSMVNCFLIREPEHVIASYGAVREQVTLQDIGFTQQAELFEHVAGLRGETPIVIDSAEFLQQPEAQLRAICEFIGVSFDTRMLNWPAGPRDSDGVWAKYWYDSVCKSTGFTSGRRREPELSPQHAHIAALARPYYERLYEHRIQV